MSEKQGSLYELIAILIIWMLPGLVFLGFWFLVVVALMKFIACN